MNWSRYPQGRGLITAHRDPAAYTGVIAIVTLASSATFRVLADGESFEHLTQPGDLVLLRAGDWPTKGVGRPRHEAEPPKMGERIIVTFRHNGNGPGAGYIV